MKSYARRAFVRWQGTREHGKGSLNTPSAALKMALHASDGAKKRRGTNPPELVLNPNVLVNLVSRRARQLNAAGGGTGRALVDDSGSLSAADIALHEIIQGKMSFEMPKIVPLIHPSGKNRNRPRHWASS